MRVAYYWHPEQATIEVQGKIPTELVLDAVGQMAQQTDAPPDKQAAATALQARLLNETTAAGERPTVSFDRDEYKVIFTGLAKVRSNLAAEPGWRNRYKMHQIPRLVGKIAQKTF